MLRVRQDRDAQIAHYRALANKVIDQQFAIASDELDAVSCGRVVRSPRGPLTPATQRTLKALARRRGEDHRAVTLPSWVNHDLRRVVRSGLSALRIPHNVAEAVLAHRPPGIVGTYNLHEYEDEKAEALEAWAQRVASLANPEPAAPAKVVKLRGRRR